MKIHAKTTLVVRREGDGLRRYVHIGTGNYHATTARIYEDVGLFTADPDIARGRRRPLQLRHRASGGRGAFRKLARRAVHAAQRADRARSAPSPRRPHAGEHARIRIKVNSARPHAEVIEELYEASQAGAEIDLIVRAVCALRPGVPGLSESIRVRSRARPVPRAQPPLLLRGGRPQRYLHGQRRPDAAQPRPPDRGRRRRSRTRHIRAEIAAIFETLLADTAATWDLAGDGTLAPHPTEEGGASALGAVDAHASRCAGGYRSHARAKRYAFSFTALSPLVHERVSVPPIVDLPWSAMRIGVVDVGSNTIRAARRPPGGRRGAARDQGRVRLSLGAEIERTGEVSDTSIIAAERAVAKLCGVARRHAVESLDVFLTAPGRQSGNAEQLLGALTRAARHPVRVLSTDEEGAARLRRRRRHRGHRPSEDDRRLRRRRRLDRDRRRLAAHRAGLGLLGRPGLRPARSARVDGLGGGPAPRRARAFAAVAPPAVEAALAVGGSARATRRLVGPWLGEAELAEALRLVETRPAREIARRFRVDRARARILPAGVAILAEVQGRLGVPLHVCDGGIREGAVVVRGAARRGRLEVCSAERTAAEAAVLFSDEGLPVLEARAVVPSASPPALDPPPANAPAAALASGLGGRGRRSSKAPSASPGRKGRFPGARARPRLPS